MKLTVNYHSETGNTQKVAQVIAGAAQQLAGVEALAMSIDNLDESYITDSSAIIFGCPTYCGTISWKIKKFFNTTSIKLNANLAGYLLARTILVAVLM